MPSLFPGKCRHFVFISPHLIKTKTCTELCCWSPNFKCMFLQSLLLIVIEMSNRSLCQRASWSEDPTRACEWTVDQSDFSKLVLNVLAADFSICCLPVTLPVVLPSSFIFFFFKIFYTESHSEAVAGLKLLAYCCLGLLYTGMRVGSQYCNCSYFSVVVRYV